MQGAGERGGGVGPDRKEMRVVARVEEGLSVVSKRLSVSYCRAALTRGRATGRKLPQEYVDGSGTQTGFTKAR